MKYVDPTGETAISMPIPWWQVVVPRISIPRIAVPTAPFPLTFFPKTTIPNTHYEARLGPENTSPPPGWSGEKPPDDWNGDEPPGEGWFRNKPNENWRNENGEWWRADLDHSGKVRPHWDYGAPDKTQWRYYPDTGTWQHKSLIIGPQPLTDEDGEAYDWIIENCAEGCYYYDGNNDLHYYSTDVTYT